MVCALALRPKYAYFFGIMWPDTDTHNRQEVCPEGPQKHNILKQYAEVILYVFESSEVTNICQT